MSTGTRPPPGPLTLEIARTLTGELARQKMSKTVFAAKVGTVSKAQMNKMINGNKSIDMDNLGRMAFVLGLDLEKLVHDADLATLERHLI